jgi:hypothetical protein
MTILIISRLIESLILSFSLFDLLHLLSLLLFLLPVKFFDFHRTGSLSSQRLLPARLSIFKHILDETLDLVGSLGERWIFGSHKISKARKDRIDFVCLDQFDFFQRLVKSCSSLFLHNSLEFLINKGSNFLHKFDRTLESIVIYAICAI